MSLVDKILYIPVPNRQEREDGAGIFQRHRV